MEISTRESVHGTEFMFRFKNKLYVFKTKAEAEIKLAELKGETLF